MSIMPENVALTQVMNRLSNATDGLNATFATLAALQSLPAAQVCSIDFVSSPSRNFVLGNVDPVDFEETSVFKYPLLTLFAVRSASQDLQKFTTFSGTVVLGLNVYLSWLNNSVLRDFESYGNCVIGAIYEIFNRMRNQSDQDWSSEVAYNGDIAVSKSPIKRDAANWFQQLAFTITFEVVAV